jgi:filamentous hemagglutinin family protein
MAQAVRDGHRRRLLAGCALVAVTCAPGFTCAQVTLAGAAQVSAGGQAPIVTQTGGVTDITLGAPRTILNWSSFNLASDQAAVFRFGDRSWVVLNRVSGQAVINGAIEALAGGQRGAGNVWFQAPGGVVFGPDARVNVGGLLATSGAVAAAGFLDPSNRSFAVTGAGAGQVQVRSGAELKSSGAVVLAAGSVTTDAGGAVLGGSGSSVLYGAANDFTVRFTTQAGDFDLVDFVVPPGGGSASTVPLNLRGATAAGNVFLALVSRADVAAAVISAPGVIAAQSASTDRGDVVLSAGVDIVNRQPGTTRTNVATETTATFGVLGAQRDLLGGFGQPTAITVTQLAAGRDLGLSAASLEAGTVHAGRFLTIDAARNLTLRSGGSAGATASLRTGGALAIGSGGFNTLGRLQLDVGAVTAGQVSAGRSLVVNASGAGPNGAPAVSIGSALAGDDIVITTTGASGGLVLGSAFLTGMGADDAPTGRTLSLTTRGASADISFGGLTGTPLAGVGSLVISAGRDATVTAPGLLTLTNGQAGRTFTIRAGNLDLAGPLTATNVRIEALVGTLTLGGATATGASATSAAAAPEGLRITDAEFQRISVTGEAGFYAGSPVSAPRGDFTVLDLAVDPGRVHSLFIGAGGENDVLVTGRVAPGVDGGIVTIGEAMVGAPFRPGRILVTGSIGIARGSQISGYQDVRTFNQVNLNAGRDVILGSPRFVALVAATPPGEIDLNRNLPAGVAPTADEQDRVFVAAGGMSLSASQRIVQQNTGTVAKPNGILITAGAAVDGARLNVTAAQVVDVFGALRDRGGGFRDLSAAAQVSGRATPGVRINGCQAAEGGCSMQASLQKAIQARDLQDVKDPGAAAADPTTGLPPTPPVVSVAQPDPEAIVADPVQLGTGSSEIWRQQRRR